MNCCWQAETKDDAQKAFDLFIKIYEPKYPKATLCLQKDRTELMAFFDFPAQHWQSIRTSNPIESDFATIRHRTKRSKGCLSRNGMLHIPLVTFLRNALPGNGCSSWANALSKTGESYAALTTSLKSSQASRSKTESKPQTRPDRSMTNKPQTHGMSAAAALQWRTRSCIDLTVSVKRRTTMKY